MESTVERRNTAPGSRRRIRTAVVLLVALLPTVPLAACVSGGGQGPGDPEAGDAGPGGDSSRARVVRVDAPNAEVATRWAGLEFSALLVKSPADRVRVRARVRNVGSGLLSRHVPWCLVRLRAYLDGRVLPDPVQERECAGFERLVSLAPGESTEYHHWIPAERLLPDDRDEAVVVLRVRLPRETRPGVPPRAEREMTLARLEVRRWPGRQSRDSGSLSCEVREQGGGARADRRHSDGSTNPCENGR